MNLNLVVSQKQSKPNLFGSLTEQSFKKSMVRDQSKANLASQSNVYQSSKNNKNSSANKHKGGAKSVEILYDELQEIINQKDLYKTKNESCQTTKQNMESVISQRDKYEPFEKVSLKSFNILKCVGIGGFSRVFLVQNKKNNEIYAMKLIEKHNIIDSDKQQIIQNERDILANLDNHFLLRLEFAFETSEFICFITEYCSGGELFFHLRLIRYMSEKDARYYFLEILAAIEYLHKNEIIYRDLKPENILLDNEGHLRICDFGLSKPNISRNQQCYSFCGSPEYMAPEMLLKTGHDFSLDYYCLGAILFELVTGLPPFYSHNTNEIYERIINEQLYIPSDFNLTFECKDLINKLLKKNSNDRLGSKNGIDEIINHPWCKKGDYYEAIKIKKYAPPYKPNCQQQNYDEAEFKPGEKEFNEKLQKAQLEDQNFVRRFPNLYYNREENDARSSYDMRYGKSNKRQINISLINQNNININPQIQYNSINDIQNKLNELPYQQQLKHMYELVLRQTQNYQKQKQNQNQKNQNKSKSKDINIQKLYQPKGKTLKKGLHKQSNTYLFEIINKNSQNNQQVVQTQTCPNSINTSSNSKKQLLYKKQF